ncbi:recombinase family protein [Amycolatopsis sp. A1MSW2902]|uniref:recombinase family protein n=2 Tax=Amycolatopsis sp. A1MSW2902 TaxID=687413 RepID=UPI00307F05A4
MTRYGYARVSAREQNPESQFDALTQAGVAPENVVIEKISGELVSRPKLDKLLATLQAGDQVTVTRLRRIGRNHQHLRGLSKWFEEHEVDFQVLEQGIDTSTPIGRSYFRFMAALDEFDREAVVEGTLEGLASARARGRVGGRPAKLTQRQLNEAQRQLNEAQRMYDAGNYTAEEIAGMFGVARSTLYKQLSAHQDGRDCALVVYRNTRPGKVDPDTNRPYGETAAGEEVQLEADRKWFPIAPARRPRLKAIVYVVNGVVARVRGVDPDLDKWGEDHRGYADVPVTKPLTELQIAERLPTLGLTLGDPRPHVKGKIREYVAL